MYIPTSNVQEIVSSVEKFDVQKNETVVIMLGEKQIPNIDELVGGLNKLEVDFLVGIFQGYCMAPKNMILVQ